MKTLVMTDEQYDSLMLLAEYGLQYIDMTDQEAEHADDIENFDTGWTELDHAHLQRALYAVQEASESMNEPPEEQHYSDGDRERMAATEEYLRGLL